MAASLLSVCRDTSGQASARNFQEELFSTISQRASRGPEGVRRQIVWPWCATTPGARHVQSALAGKDAKAKT